MRILVCGGRDYSDVDHLHAVLDRIHRERGITIIIHGAARGADDIASRWALMHSIPRDAYPADWQRHGKRAGYLRNQQMLDEGQPDAVVAAPGGRGTEMMCQIAEKAGVPVWRLTGR